MDAEATAACREHDTELVFFDNTYMYPRTAAPQVEETPFEPRGRKLESALAAEGLRDLEADLLQGGEPPATVADLAELGVAYVDFALRRPALFRLMFGTPCDDANDAAGCRRLRGLS